MSEHTEDRIEAFTQDSFSGWWALREKDGHEIGSGDGGLFESDARRLASAWNAFEGISSSLVDYIADNGGVLLLLSGASEKESELSAANSRIAKLESLVAERDAMLGKRPCQNSRCLELNVARALLREVLGDEEIHYEAADKVRSYLAACDKPGAPNAS